MRTNEWTKQLKEYMLTVKGKTRMSEGVSCMSELAALPGHGVALGARALVLSH